MFEIGPYSIANRVILAPMAGITDLPTRRLCHSLGAGLVVSEMVTSDTSLWRSRKSQTRLVHSEEVQPRSVQIAGGDAAMMATAARQCVAQGAQIIDINMGCPAKKVCKRAAGSALLKDESLVKDILKAVIQAVDVPVTLKIRTGWSPELRNGLTIAKIAEDAGVSALAVHGRTRACRFNGQAEYDTIAEIVQAVSMPVFANGDITSAQKASEILQYTDAKAVMIGRAAQGKPWIFREINHFLSNNEPLPGPTLAEVKSILLGHLDALHRFYGEPTGIRIARKHVGWYLQTLAKGDEFRKYFNRIDCANKQHASIQDFFERLINKEDKAA